MAEPEGFLDVRQVRSNCRFATSTSIRCRGQRSLWPHIPKLHVARLDATCLCHQSRASSLTSLQRHHVILISFPGACQWQSMAVAVRCRKEQPFHGWQVAGSLADNNGADRRPSPVNVTDVISTKQTVRRLHIYTYCSNELFLKPAVDPKP